MKLIILILLYSCSHKVVTTKINNSEKSLIDNETVLRLSEKKTGLKYCYDKDMNSFNNDIKKLFLERKNFESYLSLANCFSFYKKLNQSLYFYKKALVVSNSSIQKSYVYNNLGVLFNRNNNLMKATGFFKKSLSLNGHSVVVRFNLAQNYFYLGEISKSNTYINELLNSVKHDIDFKILKAKILTKRKKYFQAYSLFRSIRPEIIISNNESASYFAMTCYKNNKIDEGLDVLSKTSKIIGEFPNLKSNLELIKTKQGES